MVGLIAKRRSDLANAAVQPMFEVHDDLAGPDALSYLFAAHERAGTLDEQHQYTERLRSKGDPFAATAKGVVGWRELELAEPENFGRHVRTSAHSYHKITEKSAGVHCVVARPPALSAAPLSGPPAMSRRGVLLEVPAMARCRFILVGLCASAIALTAGCGADTYRPTAPSASTASSATQASADGGALHASSATHGQQLTAVAGTGSGVVNVTPTAAVDGSFSAEINVSLHGAPPNTTFFVQRAPEIGRANGADGICQRAAGEAPWGPPAPNFLTFPLPAAGPLMTLTTSQGGAGAAHIQFAVATIPDGTAFDVMFRLVDDLTNPTNELRTGCFTVVGK
jgi:hypothetical protein